MIHLFLCIFHQPDINSGTLVCAQNPALATNSCTHLRCMYCILSACVHALPECTTTCLSTGTHTHTHTYAHRHTHSQTGLHYFTIILGRVLHSFAAVDEVLPPSEGLQQEAVLCKAMLLRAHYGVCLWCGRLAVFKYILCVCCVCVTRI
jgi:hypothetical protein